VKPVKARNTVVLFLVIALLAVFLFLVAQFFYWWIVASVIGFAVLLLYERWKTPKKQEN